MKKETRTDEEVLDREEAEVFLSGKAYLWTEVSAGHTNRMIGPLTRLMLQAQDISDVAPEDVGDPENLTSKMQRLLITIISSKAQLAEDVLRFMCDFHEGMGADREYLLDTINPAHVLSAFEVVQRVIYIPFVRRMSLPAGPMKESPSSAPMSRPKRATATETQGSTPG